MKDELKLYDHLRKGGAIDSYRARVFLGIHHLQAVIESLKKYLGSKVIREFYRVECGKRARFYKMEVKA